MVLGLSYFTHRRACQQKQDERASRIKSLPAPYHGPILTQDKLILSKSIEELVHDVHEGDIQPVDILRSYGKAAIAVHKKTNCVTEVMIVEAEKWAKSGINRQGPLAGIPVSLKDSMGVGGFDSSAGYSCNTGKPLQHDGGVVKLLKDAGAIPYVKTNLPVTLLSFESTNDVWGRSTNPHNSKYSPGGSTGGEAALLAAGGGRIGIGSDVAGSVRVPAHFSGIYSLRCSTGRWPKAGFTTSMPGQEGVPSVFSPMARTLEDLIYFTESVMSMKPWVYDHSVHALPWRELPSSIFDKDPQAKVGVLRTDGVVKPSPACARALEEVVSALKADGCTVEDISPPSPYEGLKIASHLLNSDGCKTFRSFFRTGEWEDPGAAQMSLYANLPRPIAYLWYLWVKYVRKDAIWADLLKGWGEKSTQEQWELVAKREAYRATWNDWWNENDFDFIITVPNATPAVLHGGMKQAVSSCGYTFLFNLLDYSCGVMPVTHVDKNLDQLDPSFKPSNGVERGAYSQYDATAMHGLPVGVQVVCRRQLEEWVLGWMKVVQTALRKHGKVYKLLELDDL